MNRVLRSSFVTFIALSALQGAAHADDDPRRIEAEALMKEGRGLEDKKREDEALVRFQKAYSVYPTANILFAMASSEQLVGKSLDALRHFRQATPRGRPIEFDAKCPTIVRGLLAYRGPWNHDGFARSCGGSSLTNTS